MLISNLTYVNYSVLEYLSTLSNAVIAAGPEGEIPTEDYKGYNLVFQFDSNKSGTHVTEKLIDEWRSAQNHHPSFKLSNAILFG